MTIEAERCGLVMDLGVSEGNDTAFYLAKGFRVIAVEADVNAYNFLRVRFADAIAAGHLTLLNFAASDTFGEPITFFSHPEAQAISAVAKRYGVSDTYAENIVYTVNWPTLLAQQGMPRYLKIDIEGNEARFLQSMLGDRRTPEFMSVECYTFPPIEMMYEMGYRRFKLVDQNPPGGFKLPSLQFEGIALEDMEFVHASGPFGLDIFTTGGWREFAALKEEWEAAVHQMGTTWFDCHAWKPG